MEEKRVTNSTPLIKMSTGQYPLYLQYIRQNDNVSFEREPLYEKIIELGYGIVEPSMPPQGDKVSEGAPVETEVPGVYVQGWVVTPFTEEERLADLEMRKESLRYLINMRRDEAFERGYHYTVEPGKVIVLQMRADDRVNVLGERIVAKESIEAGSPETFIWRDGNDNFVTLTAEQMIQMADDLRVQYRKVMAAAWDLKDLVKLAETKEELPEIPAIIAAQA